jgi:hypothetical protein
MHIALWISLLMSAFPERPAGGPDHENLTTGCERNGNTPVETVA